MTTILVSQAKNKRKQRKPKYKYYGCARITDGPGPQVRAASVMSLRSPTKENLLFITSIATGCLQKSLHRLTVCLLHIFVTRRGHVHGHGQEVTVVCVRDGGEGGKEGVKNRIVIHIHIFMSAD